MVKKHPKKSSEKATPKRTHSISAIPSSILSPVRIFLSALGILSTVIVFWPRISVDPAAMFDSRSPFQSTFQVKNDGFLICYTVESAVTIKKIDLPSLTVQGGHYSNMRGMEIIKKLCPNDRSDISLQNTLSFPPSSVNSAELYIDLSYKPLWFTWLPFRFHDSYRFKAERMVNGDYFWRRFFSDK